MNHVGFFIRSKRKQLGIEAKDFCKKLKISQGYLSLIEHGKVLPNKEVLIKMSKPLQASSWDLLRLYLRQVVHNEIGEFNALVKKRS
jgi:transcriptional regulator with XRE-family HTH domain